MPEPSPRGPARSLLAAPVVFYFGLLLVLSLSRVAHVAWQHPRVAAVDGVGAVLLGGLRMDVLVLSMVSMPLVLCVLVLGGLPLIGRLVALVARVWCVIWAWYFVFLEASTPRFVLEFDRRPDRLFIEYLVHPKEVGAMLFKGYKLELALGAVVSTLAFVGAWKLFGRVVRAPRPMPFTRRAGWLGLLLPLLFLGARSSLRHRAANPSTVAFSSDHLVNDLALSSGYSVLYAVYSLKDEADAGAAYGELESEEAMVAEVRRAMVTVAPADFVDPQRPTLHKQVASVRRARPLNLVILLQESLGAQYCAALGGRPVTQFLDTLADDSWWFERMYATGTRSVRGIEAVVSGYLPTPARSVVKLGKSQRDFFTLAEFLNRQGYRTQFIYGGESHFDNMRRFFTGNGFKEVIDRADFVNPRFVGSWGVCDDDMCERLHQELMATGEQPLFTLAFSVSNHSPWEFPEGRIEPFEQPGPTVENAVRYADAALASFFARARTSPYWDHTLFVVVADHDSRVHGSALVPIPRFHIPAAILGADLQPRRDARIASQVDLGPTLISLLGLDGVHPMVGNDLTRLPADATGRAIMQYDDNQAFLEGERVVILQPEQAATQYTFDGEALHPAPLDAQLARKALAHALMPSYLYRERRYDLPPTASPSRAGQRTP